MQRASGCRPRINLYLGHTKSHLSPRDRTDGHSTGVTDLVFHLLDDAPEPQDRSLVVLWDGNTEGLRLGARRDADDLAVLDRRGVKLTRDHLT